VAIGEEAEPPPYGDSIIAQISFYLRLLHGSGDFALTEHEADGLASAIAGVARYHVKLSGSGRGMAYLALAGTAAMIYTPKLMVASAKAKARKEAPPPPPADPNEMVMMQ
jgi:hypothetical protein